MKTQINSDKSVGVSAGLIRSVNAEVDRLLGRFSEVVTRVEIHLSDVNGLRAGSADKRCMVEARPAGLPPLSVSGSAATVEAAIVAALKKMQRALATVFGRQGRSVGSGASAGSVKARRPEVEKPAKAAKRPAAPRGPAKEAAPVKTAGTTGRSPKKAKEAAPVKTAGTTGRSPKKKGIYQARRKRWPAR